MNENPLLSAGPEPGTKSRNLHAASLIRLLGAFASLLVIALSDCLAVQSCTLAWNASSGATGYRLRYGETSGNLNQSVDAGNSTTRTVTNLKDATRYYFTVVAYNSAGVESQPSNQVSYTTPGSVSGGYTLTVVNGTGDGTYAPGTSVPVSANQPGSGQQFNVWTGDTAILPAQDLNDPTTTALMPSTNVSITATYSGATGGSDRIRFYPRQGWENRMAGGVFEGTNTSPNGSYSTIYTINNSPPSVWSQVYVSLGTYRYLRYRGPDGSYGNVAEIEFYRGGSEVTGTPYGTAGSYNNSGATFDKAFDGNVNTFFDAPGDNGYVGIDSGSTGSSQTVSIWRNGDTPQVADSGPDNPVELGVKFRSDVAGRIIGIRFYKSSANTGRHVGNLWSSSGTLLATATFNGETASGWQRVNFATPVSINANTVYVASYHCDSGHYSADLNYFSANSGEDNPPLHALPSTSSNPNGVYAYGANSTFPSQSFNSCNYWVDVVFDD